MKQSIAAALMALGMSAGAWAQVGIGSSGLPSYTVPIAVPPGIAGMTPQLSLLFSGGRVHDQHLLRQDLDDGA